MKTIGFAGTFYTLWDVESERVDIAIGASYNKITCTYYRNLSKDLSEAILKAGTNNVDETLKGKRKSFEYKTPIKLEPSIMTEAESLSRIILVNQPENLVDGIRQAAFDRALELGYLVPVNGNYSHEWYVDDELKKIELNTAHKWVGNLRFPEDEYYHSGINKYIIGIF